MITPENKSRYINALVKEISLRHEYLGTETVSTIYIGGGTPSVLSVSDLSVILSAIHKNFSVADQCETTIELNPDDVTLQYMKGLMDMGINRTSLGIQSWHDADLKYLNRRHDALTAEEALKNIFRAGFENVTIDLIYGIPGMSMADWTDNLKKSFTFDIKHLSAYHLTIEKGTVFGKMLEKGLISEIDEEQSISLFNELIEKAEEAGFVHYEISNFGKPGFFSLHNSNYWKQVKYAGFGPSAHSFNGYSRQWNISDVRSYMKSLDSGKIFFEKEELDTKTRFNEYIMTSLRTMWGIDLDFVERVFEKEGYDYVINLSGKFISYGLMNKEKNSLVLSNQGKMISDNIISEFMMPD